MLRVRRRDLASQDEQSLHRGQGHTECLGANLEQLDWVRHVLPRYSTGTQIFLRALPGDGEALMRSLWGQIHGPVFVARRLSAGSSVGSRMNVKAQSM